MAPRLVGADDQSHRLSAEEQRTVALFERCSASVVHINTFVERDRLVLGRRGLQLDPVEIPQGTGSGFAWDARHIVTNFHVIKGADRASVVLSDQRTVEARLVGAEPDCDLAVLEVAEDKLPPLERGSSAELKVGQRVLAIGNPFGLDQTLTSGIVSGLGREMRGASGRMMRGLVQTDAAINPGNSGGPLLDARGRLIGVNTMIASPSGAFAGVGFAIPVDTVDRVVQQLLVHGRARRAWLGAYLAPAHVAQQLSKQLRAAGQQGLEGALVLSLEPGGPADRAGLRPSQRTRMGFKLGDEVFRVGAKSVTSAEDLQDAVSALDVGEELELHVRRREEGATRQVQVLVKLGERPREQEAQEAQEAHGIPTFKGRSRL